MADPHSQAAYGVRFDWGLPGARAITSPPGSVIAVVVDVLSFTTTLTVALDLGTTVWPYRWADDTAAGFAERHDAVLAVGRGAAGPGQISLSPHTLRRGEPPRRLVLPSPNGSAIAAHLAGTVEVCLAASLRNAAAVADWIARHFVPGSSAVALVAAGERWPDAPLRPAAEDLWGAGAVLDRLTALGWTGLSPEAELARAGYLRVCGEEAGALSGCASGRELHEAGYGRDVEIAAEVGQSETIPLLREASFQPSTDPAP